LLLMMLARFSANAQEATVTFYTNGSVLATATPGNKHGIFAGSIFDGDLALFRFQGHGFEKNQDRFVTVTLPPGPHNFAASYSKDASHDTHVTLVLEAGSHYFLRANAEAKGIVIIGSETGILNEVDCNIAHQEIGKGKALVPRRVAPSVQATTSSSEPLPSCQ
jgi:hypothetical protein